MKRLAAIWLICVAAAAAAAEQSTVPVTKPTEDVVDAARDAKAKRKKSTTKVITNKDVKNSKGKLIILNDSAPLPAVKKESLPTVQQLDARHRARVEAQERSDAAAAKVAELEKRLEAIEQRYFEENDPNYRDTVIRKEFQDTRFALNEAKDKLLEAVAALQSLDKPKS